MIDKVEAGLTEIGLIVLSVFVVAITIYFSYLDDRQGACMANSLERLTTVQTLRGELVVKESAATRAVISDVLKAESEQEVEVARNEYFTAMRRIDEQREKNPIPSFDARKCE